MDGGQASRIPPAIVAAASAFSVLTSIYLGEMFALEGEFDPIAMRFGILRILPIAIAVGLMAALVGRLRWFWAVPFGTSVGLGLAVAYVVLAVA